MGRHLRNCCWSAPLLSIVEVGNHLGITAIAYLGRADEAQYLHAVRRC
jgi:hypothetical protein